jgi:hypothetical protein
MTALAQPSDFVVKAGVYMCSFDVAGWAGGTLPSASGVLANVREQRIGQPGVTFETGAGLAAYGQGKRGSFTLEPGGFYEIDAWFTSPGFSGGGAPGLSFYTYGPHGDGLDYNNAPPGSQYFGGATEAVSQGEGGSTAPAHAVIDLRGRTDPVHFFLNPGMNPSGAVTAQFTVRIRRAPMPSANTSGYRDPARYPKCEFTFYSPGSPLTYKTLVGSEQTVVSDPMGLRNPVTGNLTVPTGLGGKWALYGHLNTIHYHSDGQMLVAPQTYGGDMLNEYLAKGGGSSANTGLSGTQIGTPEWIFQLADGAPVNIRWYGSAGTVGYSSTFGLTGTLIFERLGD